MYCNVMSCHVMSCILCCCFFIMTREIKSTTELSISRHLTAVQHNVPVLGQLKSEDECLGALSLTLPLSPAYTSSFSCLHFLFLLLTLPLSPAYTSMSPYWSSILIIFKWKEFSVRESVYRDQLARVLEDARVKNAMMLEAQRQVLLPSSLLGVVWCGVVYFDWLLTWSSNW